MNSVASNNLSLKYQRFTSSGWKYIEIGKTIHVSRRDFSVKFNMSFLLAVAVESPPIESVKLCLNSSIINLLQGQ